MIVQMPEHGSFMVRVEINPDAPREPPHPRDECGRFRKRRNITLADGDCGEPRWSIVASSEEQ